MTITVEQKNLAFLEFSLFLYSIPSIETKIVNGILEKLIVLIEKIYVPYLSNEVCEELIRTKVPEIIRASVDVIFEVNNSPVFILNTQSKRETNFKEMTYIAPKRSVIDYETITTFVKDDNNFKYPKQEKIPRCLTYVSLKRSLEILFENPLIYKEVCQYSDFLSREKESGSFSSFMQGSLWEEQKKKFIDKTVLPIFMFIDDFQPLNALGSHNLEQKLTGVFFSCPFLPPELMNKSENIFLGTIFRQKYSKQFDKDRFYSTLIQELNDLSRNGIEIFVEGCKIKLYFQLALVIGDNLALNEVLGFSESFNSTYFCRLCRANSKECSQGIFINPDDLRTIENYQKDLEEKNAGVREDCIFHKLDNYHIIKNQSQDFMHDGPEGLVHYSLGNILVGLIEEDNLFSVEEYNTR